MRPSCFCFLFLSSKIYFCSLLFNKINIWTKTNMCWEVPSECPRLALLVTCVTKAHMGKFSITIWRHFNCSHRRMSPHHKSQRIMNYIIEIYFWKRRKKTFNSHHIKKYTSSSAVFNLDFLVYVIPILFITYQIYFNDFNLRQPSRTLWSKDTPYVTKCLHSETYEGVLDSGIISSSLACLYRLSNYTP